MLHPVGELQCVEGCDDVDLMMILNYTVVIFVLMGSANNSRTNKFLNFGQIFHFYNFLFFGGGKGVHIHLVAVWLSWL